VALKLWWRLNYSKYGMYERFVCCTIFVKVI